MADAKVTGDGLAVQKITPGCYVVGGNVTNGDQTVAVRNMYIDRVESIGFPELTKDSSPNEVLAYVGTIFGEAAKAAIKAAKS